MMRRPVITGVLITAVARRAHRSYGELVRNCDRSGYNKPVHRITQTQLDRAANALADLLVRL